MGNRMFILIGAALAIIGFLYTFAGVADIYDELETELLVPVTENITVYTASDNTTVTSYNEWDWLLVHNFPYILYLAAFICVIVGVGKIGGET